MHTEVCKGSVRTVFAVRQKIFWVSIDPYTNKYTMQYIDDGQKLGEIFRATYTPANF